MNSKTFRYPQSIKKMEHNGLVILASIRNGMNFKMTKECFDILDEFIRTGITVDEFMAAFEDDEDREYFSHVLEVLDKYGLIIDSDEPEKYIFTLEITNRCNLQCKHCCMSALKANICTDPLTTDDWKKLIDKLDGIDIDYITITGGEPMIRDDFFEISEYAKERLNVPLQLMSNATLINESNVDKLMELFDDFSFSLDGADEESCATIRGKGVFGKAMKSIELLKAKGMDKFSLSFTKTKLNQDKLEKFFDLCKELDAFPMQRNYDYIGRAAENDYLLPDNLDLQFEPAIAAPSPDGHYYPEDMPVCISCSGAAIKFSIGYDGTLYPCAALMIPDFEMGDMKKVDSIAEYISEKHFKDTKGYEYFAEMHPATSKKCAECPVKIYCDSCVLYSYLMKNRDNFDALCANKKKVLMSVWN